MALFARAALTLCVVAVTTLATPPDYHRPAAKRDYAAIEEPNDAPKSYRFAYSSNDAETDQRREEQSDEDGNVRGSYSFVLPDGTKRRVRYIADEAGFRVKIDSNEPGLEAKNPADVKLVLSEAPNQSWAPVPTKPEWQNEVPAAARQAQWAPRAALTTQQKWAADNASPARPAKDSWSSVPRQALVHGGESDKRAIASPEESSWSNEASSYQRQHQRQYQEQHHQHQHKQQQEWPSRAQSAKQGWSEETSARVVQRPGQWHRGDVQLPQENAAKSGSVGPKDWSNDVVQTAPKPWSDSLSASQNNNDDDSQWTPRSTAVPRAAWAPPASQARPDWSQDSSMAAARANQGPTWTDEAPSAKLQKDTDWTQSTSVPSSKHDARWTSNSGGRSQTALPIGQKEQWSDEAAPKSLALQQKNQWSDESASRSLPVQQKNQWSDESALRSSPLQQKNQWSDESASRSLPLQQKNQWSDESASRSLPLQQKNQWSDEPASRSLPLQQKNQWSDEASSRSLPLQQKNQWSDEPTSRSLPLQQKNQWSDDVASRSSPHQQKKQWSDEPASRSLPLQQKNQWSDEVASRSLSRQQKEHVGWSDDATPTSQRQRHHHHHHHHQEQYQQPEEQPQHHRTSSKSSSWQAGWSEEKPSAFSVASVDSSTNDAWTQKATAPATAKVAKATDAWNNSADQQQPQQQQYSPKSYGNRPGSVARLDRYTKASPVHGNVAKVMLELPHADKIEWIPPPAVRSAPLKQQQQQQQYRW